MNVTTTTRNWIFAIGGAFIFTILMLFIFVIGYQRIDAGHVGIKVNLYGTNKGVQDVTEVSGAVWYNRITTVVYEFPTYVQNKAYTAHEAKGSKTNQEFRVSTKDGLVASFDVSINYRIEPSKVVPIFRKYRKRLDELNETIIYNYLRDAFNTAASQFTCERLYEQREKFTNISDSLIRDVLEREGFIIEQVVLLNEIRLPDRIKSSILAKAEAKEAATKKREELASAEADAKKAIAKAQGMAEAAKIAARGRAEAIKIEAEANSKLQQSLTPQILRKMWIDRWNGVLPSTMTSDNAQMLMQIK
jgi:regulator of protease activity HflC (stomatin/prohibitin superfamily)